MQSQGISYKPNYDELHKIILIGDSGVGKSSIVSRYTDNKFSLFLINTVGVDFKSKTIDIGTKKIRQQIWDTSGQERYKAITRNYFREADGIIVVFDVTDESSFGKIMEWLEEAYNHLDPQKCQKLLIGNKNDLIEKRAVNYDAAENAAISLGMSYYETSAKEGSEIEKAFTNLSKKIMEFRTKNQRRVKLMTPEQKANLNKKLKNEENNHSLFSRCPCS